MMKKNIPIYSILTAIILMTMPFGVAMTFVPSQTESLTKYFSYFSMMPLRYGNWFPAITVLLSIVAFFLLLVGIRKANTKKAAQVCVSICIISSALSWLLFTSISVVGVCVSGIHITVLVLLIQQNYSPIK